MSVKFVAIRRKIPESRFPKMKSESTILKRAIIIKIIPSILLFKGPHLVVLFG